MYRTVIARQARLFSISVPVRKSVVDTAKETIKSADKAVGQQVVKGIELGEQAAAKVKETAGFAAKDAEIKGQQASNEAQKLGAQARDKAQELGQEAQKQADKVTKS